MVDLEGRVALITGAGRGLGNSYAQALAARGAKIVVNDLGGSTYGEGDDRSVAEQAADEINDKFGAGTAVANGGSVSRWDDAQKMVHQAVDAFGSLDIVINNAGILRDRMLVNMTEEEFDLVIDVHLKGTFCVTRHAAAYWREKSKSGAKVNASVINTSSVSGLFNNVGQTNYAAAKSGIATFSQVAAKELLRYGVRVNTIAPNARTRMSMQTPGLDAVLEKTADDPNDMWDPQHVTTMVTYLAAADTAVTGGIWFVIGGAVHLIDSYGVGDTVTSDGFWQVEELKPALEKMLAARKSFSGALTSESTDLSAYMEM